MAEGESISTHTNIVVAITAKELLSLAAGNIKALTTYNTTYKIETRIERKGPTLSEPEQLALKLVQSLLSRSPSETHIGIVPTIITATEMKQALDLIQDP